MDTIERPEVDVIILSLNRVDDTIAAIESALSQQDVEVRVQVVDQGSDADQVRTLKEFATGRENLVIKYLERNIGVPGGRNMASALGRAEFIVALDNDAVFADETVLARTAAYLGARPELGAIGFRILNFYTGEDDHTSWGYASGLWERRGEEFAARNFIGAGHAIRRSAFEATGGYDEKLFFCWEELDLSLRMLNLGYRINYCPAVAIRHKVSPEARVRWSENRFYYTLRNRIYIHYKSGSSLSRIARYTVGAVLKGIRNGFLRQSIKGVLDAVRLCRQFPCDKSELDMCRLRPEVAAYIESITPQERTRVWQKIRYALAGDLR